MTKKLATVVVLFVMSLVSSGFVKPDEYVIDAQKNAVMHNNLGLNDVADKNYYAAIQEFSIAISLNPKTQATSVYYNNLGETYMKIRGYREAQGCFDLAIKQYNLNLLYYQNLVKSFQAQKIVKNQIKIYQAKETKSTLNMMMLGLLYVANGDTRRGIIKLDEFCMREPDLIITGAVRNYLSEMVAKEQ